MLRVFLLAACVIGAFAAKDYTGYKVLTVTPPSNDDSSIEFLHSLGSEFDVWGESGGTSPSADILIPGRAEGPLRSKLEQMGFTIKTKIADVQPLIDQQIKSTAGFNYDDYNTLDEIRQWMIDFTAENSDLVEMEMIGETYEGRDINKLRISSDLSDTSKPIFFVIGGTHGREWITIATMINFAKHLVDSRYSSNSLLKYMEFNIVPVFNQDCYEYNWTQDRMWRKTRRPNEGSPCVGTDPNRNYNHSAWGNQAGSSDRPCTQTYMGTHPASQIEIIGMQNHVYAIRDKVKVFMDVHGYMQYWMYPYSYSETVLTADHEELDAASLAAVNAIYPVHGKLYKHGTISTVIYVASGSSADWSYDVAGIKHSYALELRDTGEYGHLLPPSQIRPSFEDFYAGCEGLVKFLDENGALL